MFFVPSVLNQQTSITQKSYIYVLCVKGNKISLTFSSIFLRKLLHLSLHFKGIVQRRIKLKLYIIRLKLIYLPFCNNERPFQEASSLENIFYKMIYFTAETHKGRWEKVNENICVTLFKITFRSRIRKKKETWFQIYLVSEK